MRRLVVVNLIVLAGLLLVIEGTASVSLVVGRWANEVVGLYSPNDKYLSLPMYRNSPQARAYWREFKLSSRHEYVDYIGWRRKDFEGEYINVVGGHRATATGHCANGPALGMFGGSAIWGTGVSDAETIPSWVAKSVGEGLRVCNYGEAGYVAFQNFLAFREALRKDQQIRYAVFYDGVNDAHASCVNPAQDGATLLFNRMKEKIEHRQAAQLRLFQFARAAGEYWRQPDAPPGYRCDEETTASQAALAMVNTWRAIEDLARQHGVKAYFFLQPVSYVGGPDVSYLELDQSMNRSFRNFYRYVDLHAQEKLSERYTNLSQILSNRGRQYYIDFAHVTSEANRTIAEAIVARLELR